MGVDHTRSTFRFGDHDMRLTDVKGHVVHAARDVCSNEPLAIYYEYGSRSEAGCSRPAKLDFLIFAVSKNFQINALPEYAN